jgi:phosphomannomutase
MALMVSVSGVRGIVGEALTPQVALEFARAYGTYLAGGRVVLGRDSRRSGEMFAGAAAAGLIAAGCAVTHVGVVMTPTAGLAIRAGGYDGGVVITASHNPPAWNGLKFLDGQGLGPDPAQVNEIAAIREQGRYANLHSGFRATAQDQEAGERHVEAVLAALEVDVAPLKGLRVVLDSVNGAGGLHSPALLTGLGCELIQLNGEPTGDFAHPAEPLAENLAGLCQAVRETKAAIGFAQDPDGDRLAIVDENGRYVGEEYTLALAAEFVLSRRPGPVANNLGSSRLVDDVAGRYGAAVIRTAVGESNVARAMLANDCVIGGEGNGGVIDPRICPVRDSLSGMSLVLQLMAATGKTISRLVADLPRYAMIKQKFECPRERIDAAIEAVAEAFADRHPNRSDGVRVDLDEAWVLLRASNTEPIVRISAEAADEATATALIQQVRAAAGL